MKTGVIIAFAVSSVTAVAGATAAAVILTRKKRVVKHSCSPTGECVPDPDGPFDGPTCTCVGVSTSDVCSLVGDSGKFATMRSCEARDADFQCVPGTGACERVLGANTGWKGEGECECFECVYIAADKPNTPHDLTCVPTQEVHPLDGTDGEGCLECGLWKCTDGKCEQSATGGLWKDEEDCSCGLCGENGECEATAYGGAYKSVSACIEDDAARCNEDLGWACSESAGNAETCHQVEGGAAATLEDCRCWTCAGTTPGPTSECVLDLSNTGDYRTEEECFANVEDKCGWKYACPE